MDARQALDGLTRSLQAGVSHQIWEKAAPEILEVIGLLRENMPKKFDKPMLFYFKFSGTMHLWMVENFTIFTSGPKITAKFKEGYGKSYEFHLTKSLETLAYTAADVSAHSLYLDDFGDPRPLRDHLKGFPEPSLN